MRVVMPNMFERIGIDGWGKIFNLFRRPNRVTPELDVIPTVESQIEQISARLNKTAHVPGEQRLGGWKYVDGVNYNKDGATFSGQFNWHGENRQVNFRSISGFFDVATKQLDSDNVDFVSSNDDSGRFQFDVGSIGIKAVELAGKYLPDDAWQKGVSSVRIDNGGQASVMMDSDFTESWLNFSKLGDVRNPIITYQQDMGRGGSAGDIKSVVFEFSNPEIEIHRSKIVLVKDRDGGWIIDTKNTLTIDENTKVELGLQEGMLKMIVSNSDIRQSIILPQVDTGAVLATARDLVKAIELGASSQPVSSEIFNEYGKS